MPRDLLVLDTDTKVQKQTLQQRCDHNKWHTTLEVDSPSVGCLRGDKSAILVWYARHAVQVFVLYVDV